MTELNQTGRSGVDSEPDRPAQPGAFPTDEPGKSEPQPGEGSVDFPVSVVLPAGGTGERTGLQTPKQFCTFLGRPLISYTIQAFERVSWIQRVVVVVAKENMDLMADIVWRFQHRRVRVVAGGSTRHRSISSGVLALGEEEEEEEEGQGRPAGRRPEVIIVHDAVRPFVEEDFLREIAVAAKEHGAAGAVRPLVSTVIAATSEGYLDHSLERARYRASEMPQGFAYDVIRQAYQRVTYKRDLAAAESIVKESLSRSACVVTGASAAAIELADALQKAVGPLDMELHVVPDLVGGASSRCLLEHWNFIQVSVGDPRLSEVEALLTELQAAERAPLHPPVLIWVCVRSVSDRPSAVGAAEATAVAELAASAASRWNILLYGIQLRRSQEAEHWQRSVLKVAKIASALIHERSAALVGQIMQA
ncbi:D-ribitol-5-phosphate cytidylyltransferase isoform X3 [Nelusetta ayraudi]|uniref:D-ribitol-5-phosphate cytidylyltransferase isoform X3 n=1 Tax=Nelusetta ayraudi TaxID=303726 RepID=UPI003F70238E